MIKSNEEIEKITKELEEAFKDKSFNEDDKAYLINRLSAKCEYNFSKLNSSLGKVESVLNNWSITSVQRRKTANNLLIEQLSYKDLKEAIFYGNKLRGFIKKYNQTFKKGLKEKASWLVKEKIINLNREYLRRLELEKKFVVMPPILNYDFYKEGWLIYFNKDFERTTRYALLKKTKFEIKEYASKSGFINKLPKNLCHKINCFLGFWVETSLKGNYVTGICCYNKFMKELNTFHTNNNSVCLGDLDSLQDVANVAIKDWNFIKFNQIIEDIVEMLSCINMDSPYTPMKSMDKTGKFVRDKRKIEEERIQNERQESNSLTSSLEERDAEEEERNERDEEIENQD